MATGASVCEEPLRTGFSVIGVAILFGRVGSGPGFVGSSKISAMCLALATYFCSWYGRKLHSLKKGAGLCWAFGSYVYLVWTSEAARIAVRIILASSVA